MKDQLEQLYEEYMQLRYQESDWGVRNRYLEKMKAIETILKPMPYKAKNPINQ